MRTQTESSEYPLHTHTQCIHVRNYITQYICDTVKPVLGSHRRGIAKSDHLRQGDCRVQVARKAVQIQSVLKRLYF